MEHADQAYEWEFNGLNQYRRMDMSKLNATSYNDRSKSMAFLEGELSAKEIQVSNDLKAAFPAYLNSLNLKDEQGNALTLDADGTFKTYMKNVIVRAAQQAHKSGTDLSDKTWDQTRSKWRNGH